MESVGRSFLLSVLILCFLLINASCQICNNPQYMRNFYWNTTSPNYNESCFNPSTVDEISTLVSMANMYYMNDTYVNVSVRPIGKSFSWSAIAMMETNINEQIYFVNQTEFRRSYTVDNITKTLTGEAGMRVIDVVEALREYGLGLGDFGGPLIVNFIGSFNSGTHGKGSRRNPIGNNARQVIGLEIVLPNGTIVNASKTENSDIYYANLISMGSTGIITSFTVQAVDYYEVSRLPNIQWDAANTDYDLIEDLVKRNLSKLLDFADYIYGGYQTFRERFQFQNMYFTNRTDINNGEPYGNVCWNDSSQGFNEFPCTDAYYSAISPFPTEAYTHGANWEAEFYVLEEDFEVAFLAGIKWVIAQQYCNPEIWNRTKAWHDRVSPNGGNKGEIQINTRWIGPDCIWLSPAYNDLCENGTAIAQIGIYIPGGFIEPNDVSGTEDERFPSDLWFFWNEGYYKAIRRAVPASQPVRVHWGKASLRNYCEIEDEYPKMSEFRELRAELDPNNIFVNQIVRDKLGLCGDCCCTFDTCNKTENSPLLEQYNLDSFHWTCDIPENPETTDDSIIIADISTSVEGDGDDDGDDDGDGDSAVNVGLNVETICLMWLVFVLVSCK